MKVTEHDKLLKKFMHKKALLAVLNWKNLKNVVVVMEELVARKKLLRCVSNLEIEELGLLLKFLQSDRTIPSAPHFSSDYFQPPPSLPTSLSVHPSYYGILSGLRSGQGIKE
ncbi:hypothetical protein T459_23389 [Capsicum annuum]|uniref:U3 small nucleolar RNA-associated protein 15 C-terminal domain-containing protein n=1 Tax=Capsicum annuum TaxID=4072 RepID=A0A2G2YSE8_CAPAN|nr:hypothetical protein T459_23389 [Capsicum annuum]